MKPTVLITGDIALDCHLYGGVKTAAASLNEPGTTYEQQPGGACLTHRLLAAAAGASGAFDVHLGLDAGSLDTSLPTHLRSYGVWTDRPARKGAKPRVWRVDRPFGYGPTEAVAPGRVFKPNPVGPTSPPVLTVIDDGGILFRHGGSRGAWPPFSADAETHYLLKTTSPLCRGDLWAALAPVMGRLIVVVSAVDLRREDAQIDHRLSWERCAESTLAALRYDPTARELLRAAHVVVNFRSAGALWIHRGATSQQTVRLLFDPIRLEGDFGRDFEGTVYGFQTCVTAGIAHHLMVQHAQAGAKDQGTPPSPFHDDGAMGKALELGIAAGLTTHRRLLELGHGPANAKSPGFPIDALGQIVASRPGGFVSEVVPAKASGRSSCQWTILTQAELAALPPTPLTGLAELTARYGVGALSHVPALRLGRLFTVDRSEIESLRTLDALCRDYEATKVQKKPLCIGVFGPPGAGKSFGVKALAEAILGDKAPFLEFNLSQFKSPDELIGAFHRVRDAVLKGVTPVTFWDEFDSQQYKWLQFLLAPMQDGAFQEGQITHPIGKCVFVFAGGTSSTLEEFGVAEPAPLTAEARAGLTVAARADRQREEDAFREFKLLKGPDFVSRLHGFLNVLGPNPRINMTCQDVTWPIRRALVLRAVLDLKETDELKIDPGLLHALLSVPVYRHGARSFEKIVTALVHGRDDGRLHRAALPPDSALGRETDAAEFRRLMEQWNAFKNHPDIEALAAAVHAAFLEGAAKSVLETEISRQPHAAWTMHPSVAKAYCELPADIKASNRAAARRVPDHLALINFVVVPQTPKDDDSWKKPLTDAIEKHIERLAQAEHLGWCAERLANGWTGAETRDDILKHHHLLVEWSRLSSADQDKDRNTARSIPALLQIAGFKATAAS